jgi:hypothetical protein
MARIRAMSCLILFLSCALIGPCPIATLKSCNSSEVRWRSRQRDEQMSSPKVSPLSISADILSISSSVGAGRRPVPVVCSYFSDISVLPRSVKAPLCVWSRLWSIYEREDRKCVSDHISFDIPSNSSSTLSAACCRPICCKKHARRTAGLGRTDYVTLLGVRVRSFEQAIDEVCGSGISRGRDNIDAGGEVTSRLAAGVVTARASVRER